MAVTDVTVTITAAQTDQNVIVEIPDLTVADNATNVAMIYVETEALVHSHHQEIHVDVKKNNSILSMILRKVQDIYLGLFVVQRIPSTDIPNSTQTVFPHP